MSRRCHSLAVFLILPVLSGCSGKQTELGKKQQVMEATLEATLAGDGEVMLQMIGGKEGDTDVRYKMESRPGKR